MKQKTIGKLNLGKVNQIGIVVKDLKNAASQYTQLLGIKPWFKSEFTSQETFYKEKEINLDLNILLGFSNKVEIELIHFNSHDKNIYSQILHEKGGGIHHIGYMVSDFNKKMKAFKSQGIEVIQQGVLETDGGSITNYAYFDTTKELGIITEIIETKLKGIPIPQNRFTMNIGCFTGDVKKLKA